MVVGCRFREVRQVIHNDSSRVMPRTLTDPGRMYAIHSSISCQPVAVLKELANHQECMRARVQAPQTRCDTIAAIHAKLV